MVWQLGTRWPRRRPFTRRPRLELEPLEARTLLTTTTVPLDLGPSGGVGAVGIYLLGNGDVYDFTAQVGQSGQLTVDLGDFGTGLQTRLRDAAGNLLAEQDNPPGSSQPIHYQPFLAAGSYVLEVTADVPPFAFGFFSVASAFDPAPRPFRPLDLGGAPHPSVFTTPGELQDYRFSLSQPGRFTADGVGTGFGTRLTLFGPGGELLVQSDGTPGAPDLAHLDVHLSPNPPGQSYVLEVSAPGGQVGGYSLAAQFQPASVPFAPQGVGQTPRGVLTVDLTGDGIPDLVTVNDLANAVTVAGGLGDGTFRPPLTFAVGFRPQAVVAGDLTGDGVPDLATANYGSGDVSLLRGNGDGTFQPATSWHTGFGNQWLTAADVNRDGALDLLTTNANGVALLRGNGDGTFQPVQVLNLGANPGTVNVADLNGDGLPDLVAADRGTQRFNLIEVGPGLFIAEATDVWDGRGLTVWLGNGDGSFQQNPTTLTDLGLPDAAQVTDLNGDGRPDLVIGTADYLNEDTGTFIHGQLGVLLGRGDGTLGPVQWYAVGGTPDLEPGSYAVQVTATDLNGDGVADLLATYDGSNDLTAFLGKGDGTLTRLPALTLRNDVRPAAVAAQDLDGDGRADVVIANRASGDVEVFLGNGDGTLQTAPGAGVPPHLRNVVAADLNGDGRVDLITTSAAVSDPRTRQFAFPVAVRLGNGDGTTQPGLTFNVAGQAVGTAVADLNGDGRPDLVTASQWPNALTLLFGNGDGTFQAGASVPLGFAPTALRTADVNGDGREDLIVGGATAAVLLNLGGGRLAAPNYLGANATNLAVADLNGDGRPDLITLDQQGTYGEQGSLATWIGAGDGTFALKASWPLAAPLAVFDHPQLLIGDFTGDGIPDLALTGSFRGDLVSPPTALGLGPQLLVFAGRGDGTFGDPQVLPLPLEPAAVAAADVNGDGRLDLVFPELALFGAGDGTFIASAAVPAGAMPGAVALADLNGDGRPDVAVANFQSNDLTVGLNQGGAFVPAGQVAANVQANPVLVDLDRNGTNDALFLDPTGAILWRRGRVGQPGEFDAPVIVNPDRPAQAFTVVATARGPEVAVADLAGDTVSLYRFQPATPDRFRLVDTLAAGALPSQVAAADLNGDGVEDLVVRNAGDGTLSVFWGAGSGRFSPGPALAVGLGLSEVTLAALEPGGPPAVLAANAVRGDVTVLRFAAGRFTDPVRYRAGTGLSTLASIPTGQDAPDAYQPQELKSRDATVSLVAAPFRGGDVPDLVTVNRGTDSLGLLANAGDGRLLNPQRLLSPQPGRVARAGDFNHDGRTDLALLTDTTVEIYLGDGAGGFADPVSYAAGNLPRGLTVADVNADGRPDLLVGNAYGDLLTLLGDGRGGFLPYQRAAGKVALAVADLNGDGRPDFVFANQGLDRVAVQLGTQDRAQTFQDRRDGLLAPDVVQLADLNGDGVQDMVVANSGSNNVLVYLGLGHGQFGPSVNGPQGFFTGTNPTGLTVADLNGDGRPDLAVADRGSNDVTVLFGQGRGSTWTLAAGPRLRTGGLAPVATAARDVTGDGVVDLVVANGGSADVAILFGVGGGFFNDSAAGRRMLAVGADPTALFVGTFDGRLDVVTLNARDNTVTVVSGMDPRFTTTLGSGGRGPAAGLAGDVNGDGLTDLVVANNADGHLAVLLGGPGGLELTRTLADGLANPTDLAAGAASGGTFSFYVSGEGAEAATRLTVAFAAGPAAELVQVADGNAALVLVATLLTAVEAPPAPPAAPAEVTTFAPFLVEEGRPGATVAEGNGGGDEAAPAAPPPVTGDHPAAVIDAVLGLEAAFEQCREALRAQPAPVPPGPERPPEATAPPPANQAQEARTRDRPVPPPAEAQAAQVGAPAPATDWEGPRPSAGGWAAFLLGGWLLHGGRQARRPAGEPRQRRGPPGKG